MSTRVDVFKIVVGVPALALAAWVLGWGTPEPSERDLRRRFDLDRSAFENFRAALDRPPRVSYLNLESNSGSVGRGAIVDVDLREPRLAELRSFMRWIGGSIAMNGPDGGELMVWTHPGGFRGQSTKGYAFGRPDRGPIVPSVDEAERDRYHHAGADKIYSRLGGDWFVVYDFGG
ncbi:MAG: hypothetical protein M3169_09785 [Candidatus Eremiobacteraeota bacterium]|nr:hypothetical protein [Candidatus Eremiobacteraeota bacterium]